MISLVRYVAFVAGTARPSGVRPSLLSAAFVACRQIPVIRSVISLTAPSAVSATFWPVSARL